MDLGYALYEKLSFVKLDKSKRAYIQPWIEYVNNYLSTSYHHTVSDYFNTIINAGFTIGKAEDPFPPEEWKQNCYGRYNGLLKLQLTCALSES